MRIDNRVCIVRSDASVRIDHQFNGIRLIGLISDTHGLLRKEAVEALSSSDLIVHAGDIGSPEILERLKQIAPVVAIRGNIDTAAWASDLPETLTVRCDTHLLYVLHDVNTLGFDLSTKHVDLIISGHSHKPGIVKRGNILFVNPGSAGKRRFKLPITVGRLQISEDGIDAQIIEV